MLFALVTTFALPAIAQSISSNGNLDVLGTGIFETTGSAFKFPESQDTNVDNVAVGNDKALAFGETAWSFPFSNGPSVAANNLEIKKNQDSGECACCQAIDNSCPCQDCCIKVNLESINVGNREALALGFATANNNVKIVTNQQ